MQVTETLNDGLKRAYTITVTAAELDAKVQEKLVEAQPEIEMKGFRKGKVPMAMLRKQFGPRLMGDAMQDAIDGAMKSHFDATGDRPALQPEVKMVGGDTWAEGQDVVVEMSYEALPPIPEFDAGQIAGTSGGEGRRLAVDEALANLAGSAQAFEDRKKGSKAKDGDQIVIDFKGSVDGEEFEGGSAEDYPLVLGSGSFIPGFEEQLVGAKAGDEVSVNVTFPESYGAKHLAGKAAVFACTVKAVKAPKPAEIDDELAKKYGAESLEALKGQISERLEAEYAGRLARGDEAGAAGPAGHAGEVRPAARAGRGRRPARSRTSCGTKSTPTCTTTTTAPSSRPKSTRSWPSAACAWACCWPKSAARPRSP
jgi:trigger factor